MAAYNGSALRVAMQTTGRHYNFTGISVILKNPVRQVILQIRKLQFRKVK